MHHVKNLCQNALFSSLPYGLLVLAFHVSPMHGHVSTYTTLEEEWCIFT